MIPDKITQSLKADNLNEDDRCVTVNKFCPVYCVKFQLNF